MKSFIVTYYDPNINIDANFISKPPTPNTKIVPIEPIRNYIQSLLNNYSKNEANHHNSIFQFSFFDAFDIPPYSYIPVKTLNDSPPSFGSDTDEPTPGLKTHIVSNFFKPFRTFFGNPQIRDSPGPFIHFIYGESSYPMFLGWNTNKIHLFVKDDYILYVILKLTSLSIYFPSNLIQFKFMLFNRLSNLKSTDTSISNIESDGGIVPTIVIYGSSDPKIMSSLITTIMNMFPDPERIGLMDTHGTHTLSPFNIRLNNLVSYAGGNRVDTLSNLIENIKNIKHYTTYTIPTWLKNLQKGCSKETRTGLNQQMQLFIGNDACDETGAAIDYEAKCKEPHTPDMKYCYLTKSPDMIDPRVFLDYRVLDQQENNSPKSNAPAPPPPSAPKPPLSAPPSAPKPPLSAPPSAPSYVPKPPPYKRPFIPAPAVSATRRAKIKQFGRKNRNRSRKNIKKRI